MDRQKTGAFLRKLRTDAALTQQFVADKLGVSRVKYTTLETGKAELSLSEIKKLADLYEVSADEIVEGKLVQPEGDMRDYDSDLATIAGTARQTILPREVNPQIDPVKLRAVLLYILGQVGARPNVGETVLYKLLYFIDFDYYEKNGRSITGLSYAKNHYGPTPTREFVAFTSAMRDAGELEIVSTPYFSHVQKKYLPVISADLSSLSADEIKHIDAELERLADKSATELSELSHKDMPWIAAKPGKYIDYQLAMYRTDDTSVREHDDEL